MKRIITVCLILLPLLIVGFAQASTYDGTWSGKTDQGYDVSFTVTDNSVVQFAIKLVIPGSLCTATISGGSGWTPGKQISGKTFTIKSSSFEADEYEYVGTFANSTYCTGTWDYYSQTCDGSGNGTWTASREKLTLMNPNGGEIVPSGYAHTIEWKAPPNADNFKLKLSMDFGKTWETIDKGITDMSYDWIVPTPKKNQTNCLVKITAYDSKRNKIENDKSDAPFTIEVITIISPEEGEILTSGSPYTIEWMTQGTSRPENKVILKYSKNGGRNWKKIVTIKGDDPEQHFWPVPDVPKAKAKCKIMVVLKDADNKTVAKAKSRYFTIEP